MANEDGESGVELVQDDGNNKNNGVQCPVILDGEEEQVEAFTTEVSHKLSGLAHTRKTRPWTRRQYRDDDLTKLENQQNEECHQNENTGIDADDSDKNNKSRLGELLNTFKSNDDHDTHATSRRPAFKPIRLAVAKARFANDNDDSTAALPSAVIDKKTTLALPTAEDNDAGGPVDGLDDNDDAASYLDFPRAPSPTATYTSSSSSPTNTTPEDESGIFRWLNRPTKNSKSGTSVNATSPGSAHAKLPDEPTDSSSRITRTYKLRSKKGSKASSQGDTPESPQAIDYAEIDTMRPRPPKRNDTFLRGMMPGRSDSFNYGRENSLRLPLPFRGRRRRRRKGKGKKGGEESSSEEGMDDEELFHETLKRAGLFDKDVPEQMVTELLWQNERGLSLLGTRYGKNALLPGDPGPWTDIHGNATSYNTSSFPLPTPAWRWHHAEWLISMVGDVDSEGYQYSTRFSSKYWRGIPEIRFFVRRRLWIRARYRPTLKAQKIAEFTHPQIGMKNLDVQMLRGGLHHASATVPALHDVTGTDDKLFSPMLASHLDPLNPFVSYYALKEANPRELGDSTSTGGDGASVPYKQEIIHANFVRVAKVLVRRTNVDRERLAWLEYWLGAREEPLHVTDVTAQHFSSAVVAKKVLDNSGSGQAAGDLADIEESHNDRPDIRDVWDLVEDRLDDVLSLFEYQETKRELLLLLQALHNKSHPDHHYKNRSSSPEHPSEILARHEHGTTDELGADADTRAANGDGTHMRAEEVPRLAFWSDLDERLRDIQVATGLPSGKGAEKRSAQAR